MREQKQDIVNEVRELQGLKELPLSRGSSIPREFFESIAREMGLPLARTMPDYARLIINHAGLEWKSDFSSEGSRSGGGSTITLEGLNEVRNAYILWQSSIREDGTDNESWRPPKDWQERRLQLERDSQSVLERPGAVEFRRLILDAYRQRCAITNCGTSVSIEAAHVIPYFGPSSDVVQNGICLRIDLHRAFDAGKFHLEYRNQTLVVCRASSDLIVDYPHLEGTKLRLPSELSDWPSPNALTIRERLFA